VGNGFFEIDLYQSQVMLLRDSFLKIYKYFHFDFIRVKVGSEELPFFCVACSFKVVL
jgi:hypothetical protein